MQNVIGHSGAVEMLRSAALSGRLPHAMLITGPGGVGKNRVAIEVARILNCTGPDAPCGACVHCHQIASGMHPDVLLVEPADGKDSILIQQVRELRDAAYLRPFQGRQKVYIISEAERLTLQASDALLKTLEEPQPQLTLILTAIDAEGLPATVVSRCRLISLRGVGVEDIAAALRARGLGDADAEGIAHLARGSVGWAIRASSQPRLVEQQERAVNDLASVPDLSLEARLALAETLTGDRKDRSAVRRNLEVMVLLGRDLLLVHDGLAPLLAGSAQTATLRDQAARLGRSGILSYLRALKTATSRIDQNVDPRLAIEAAMISVP